MRENLQDPSVHKDHHFFINFSCEYADQQISFTHSISRYTTCLALILSSLIYRYWPYIRPTL